MTGCAFTTSWDDGHPLDLKLAALLDRRGFGGTFYIPCRNREGLPVMPAQDVRILASRFDIGAHTRDHVYLHAIQPAEARTQVADGRKGLEDIIGKRVSGFAYPGGFHNRTLHAMVAACGFDYARTTENFRTDTGNDRFRVPTTLQLYPHGPAVYVRNFLKHGSFSLRYDAFAAILAGNTLEKRLRASLDLALRHGGIFHLWGHSWELDRIDGWKVLDEFLSYAADRIPPHRRVTNAAALLPLEAAA